MAATAQNFWAALKMALQWLTNNKATTAANSMADVHYSYPTTAILSPSLSPPLAHTLGHISTTNFVCILYLPSFYRSLFTFIRQRAANYALD